MAKIRIMATLGRLLAWWLFVAMAADAVADESLHGPQSASAPTRRLTASTASTPPGNSISLDIPDTGQEKRRPDSGWCGEAAIQMALSYYGVYASQKAINHAGKPGHPDLYANEIPVAMRSLGLEFTAWKGNGLQAFSKWVQGQLADGHPVLLGVKIYPTAHPEWGLDHFVLAVGCTKDALTLNTTWRRQETRSFTLLSSQDKGLSFVNRYGTFYGYAITGIKAMSAPDGFKPTRIRISRSGDKEVELRITAEHLERGKRYRLLRFMDLATAWQPGAKGDLVRSFVAEGAKADSVEKIGIDDARLYRCLPSSN
jgi:hypothetical protein